MSVAEVRVLGPVEVIGDEGEIRLAAKHVRLLAALLVADGQARTLEELVESVWDGNAPSSSRKLVQIYVSQLRKVLPADIEIVTAPGTYALRLPPHALDATRFERLLADVGTARGKNPALAASLAGQALALWRGRAYGDLAYEDFVRAEAERLEELRVGALEERLAAGLELGRHAELLGEVLAFANENPYRERAHELAMLSLYRSGRQMDALDHFSSVRAQLDHELGLAPGERLRELQRRILQQDPELEPGADIGSTAAALPVPPNPLVGRERELDELQGLLERRSARLLVLTGAGGSGKTRLALEAARRVAGSYANGAVLVELAPLRAAELVLPTIAHALDVTDAPMDRLLEAVASALAPREQLIVLDNAEHVREAAPSLAELLARAPRLTLLVTSRAVLHVSGEQVFPVAPLSEDAAVELFVQRARLLRPGFALAPGNESDVREICRRVDGLPLAVELAAARARTLTPKVLRARLDARLSLLTGGPRDLPARQQTLRETIGWSVDLLSMHDRSAFARLAVFAGAWSLESAQSICDVGLDELSTLVDDNLVMALGEHGDSRFTMLEVVRELAGELLETSGEREQIERRHAASFLAVAEEAEHALAGPDQGAWLERLELEHDEFRAALARLAGWGEVPDELRLAAALGRFRYVRGYLAEGRTTLESALVRGAGQPVGLRAKAHRVASALSVLLGEYDRALDLAEDGLALYEEAGDRPGIARSLSNIGAILVALGRPHEAASVLDEAVALARSLDDARLLALALNNRGDVALTLGDWDTAGERFDESLALLHRVGDEVNVARSLFNLGVVELERGRSAEAREHLAESAERCLALDDKEDIAWCLVAFAAVHAQEGDHERAARLLGSAERLLSGMGATLKPYEQGLSERVQRSSSTVLGRPRFDELRLEGAKYSLRDAVQHATAGP